MRGRRSGQRHDHRAARLTGAEAGPALPDDLLRLLSRALGGREVAVLGARRSSAGASRHTWSLDVSLEGGAPYGLVLQVERSGNGPGTTPVAAQAEVLRAAGAAGVPVARVVAVGQDERGAAYLLSERVEGETLARRLLRDDLYAGARAGFAGDCARALARLHAVPQGELPALAQPDQLTDVVATIDAAREPHPAFELAIAWLDAHRPPAVAPVPVHGDFRLGNLLLGPDGLRAVLDWELAHLGDPAEDLGWLCVRAWRFGARREVGGMADLDELLAAYAAATGRPVDPGVVFWWQVLGTLKWGAICLTQARVHLSGAARSVELAAIGRRVCETEHDLLELLP